MSDINNPNPLEESESITRRAWIILVVCSSSMFLILLDSGSMFVAFPFIEDHFSDQASRTTMSWVISGFFITMVSSLLVAGRAADKFGRRKVFLSGLVIYGTAAILGGSLSNIWALILLRAFQGMAIAMLSPTALAICLVEFPRSRRAYAFGVWGTIGAGAGLCASPIGAGLVEIFNWRAVFLFNGIAALVTLIVGRIVLGKDQEERDETPIDILAAFLATTTIASFTLVLVQGQDWGWSAPPTLTFLFLFILSGPALVYRNTTHQYPILNPEIFTSRSFNVGCLGSVFCQIGFFSIYFGLPLYMKEVWNWAPLRIGFALLPLNIVPLLTSAIAGKIVDKRGPRSMIVFGGLWSGAACILMGFWLIDIGYTYLALGLLAYGLGAMAIGNTTTIATLIGVDDNILASATSGSYTGRRLGSALGAVLAAAIVGNKIGEDFADAYLWVWVLGAAAYFLGAIVTFLFYPKQGSAPSGNNIESIPFTD
ncbi:MAG: MFS transporter [Acidimicrobiales bacterium]|nr:MFS transporter [Acidimicrobiales bacterium]